MFLQTRSALILEETQRCTDTCNAASMTLWAMGQSILPHNRAIMPLLPLEIAPRLPLTGATSLVGATMTSSPKTSVVEAVVVEVAVGADAAGTLHGSSTPAPVRLRVLMSNRGLDSPHMRHRGSRAPRSPGRRPLKDSSAHVPA
jgi:hypothetical protein